MRSDYDQGLFSRPPGGCQRYGLVERDQSSTMCDSKCQKVDVRQFPGTQQLLAVHHCIVEQANIVRDKEVMRRGNRYTQTRHCLGDVQSVWIPRLGKDAYATVLRQGARGPPLSDMSGEPIRYHLVIGVILVE